MSAAIILAASLFNGAYAAAPDPREAYPGCVEYQSLAGKSMSFCYDASEQGEVKVATFVLKGKKWRIADQECVLPLSGYNPYPPVNFSVEWIGDQFWYAFECLDRTNEGLAYYFYLFNPATAQLAFADFYGKNLADESLLPGDFRIEGMKAMGIDETAVYRPYFEEKILTDSRLVFLSDADYLTDKSVEWWLANNKRAETSATHIEMCALEPESSLVEAFRASSRQRSPKYEAAIVKVRGYQEIVAFNRSSGRYFLVYVEPVCSDKSKDRYVTNWYFENDSSISLMYYRAKTAFKRHINLTSKEFKKEK